MLTGGEDPRYIARRLTRFAAEDVGMADPRALPLADRGVGDLRAARDRPEGELALAQLVVHLATAPKSNARLCRLRRGDARGEGDRQPDAAAAHPQRADEADEGDSATAPATNTTTMRRTASPAQNYFPEGMARQRFYRPTDRGCRGRDRRSGWREWDALRARKARRR